MLKSIIAVVVGFIAMTIFSIAAFSCVYLAMGADRAFQPESYDISTLWMVAMVVLSLLGGVVGGFVCAAISKSMGVCKVFAGIALALGLLSAIVTTMKERPDTARTGDVPVFRAGTVAQTPLWLCLLNPVLGAAGILLGARKKLPAA